MENIHHLAEVFDIGTATSRALMNYAKGIAPLESGGKTEWDNGNGSLMRILPVCLYLFERRKKFVLQKMRVFI